MFWASDRSGLIKAVFDSLTVVNPAESSSCDTRLQSAQSADLSQSPRSESAWTMLAVILITRSAVGLSEQSIVTATVNDTPHLDEQLRELSLAGDAQNVGRPPASSTRAVDGMRAFADSFEKAISAVCRSSKAPAWPSVTISLLFVVHLASTTHSRVAWEAQLPWEALLKLFAAVPEDETRAISKHKAQRQCIGPPLPEDWCIRGSAWLGAGKSSLFPSAIWTQSQRARQGRELPCSEGDMLDEHYEASSMPSHAGGPGHGNVLSPTLPEGHKADKVLAAAFEDTDEQYLTRLRWRRVAWCAARLCKKVVGLKLDADSGTISMSRSLRRRMGLPVSDDVEAGAISEEESEVTQSDTGPSDLDEPSTIYTSAQQQQRRSAGAADKEQPRDDFPSLQQASAGRSRAVSGEDQLSVRLPAAAHARWDSDTAVYAVPGYTSIVVDAQMLVNGFKLVEAMVRSKRWIVIVPLAAVTELDRTSKTSTAAESAASASAVLQSLEQLVKTHSSVLKIQTSRGNYLRDLSLRAEDLEYSGSSSNTNNNNNSASPPSSSAQHSHARTPRGVDDVVVAAGRWQVEHWLDRRQLLLPGALSANEKSKKLDGKWKDAKVLLVSDNKILRAQGRTKGLSVASFRELEMVILADPHTLYEAS